MAHPKEIREKVRRDYVSGRQTLEMAALLNKIPLPTARLWKKSAKEMGDDWDKVRGAYLLASGGVEDLAQTMLAAFIVQYQDTMERLQNDENLDAAERVKLLGSLSDSYAKNISTNQKLMPKTSELAIALKVIDVLANFIAQKHPQHKITFIEILEAFQPMLIKLFD